MPLGSPRPGALVVAVLLVAKAGTARGEVGTTASAAAEEAVWRTGTDGARYRVRFDPGQRLLVGMGIGWGTRGEGEGYASGGVIEVGLLLRSERPASGWEVHWKRNHEIARLRLDPVAAEGLRGTGALYRGLFLRQSREGTLTLPTAPPVAIPLPFDIGLALELGRVEGTPDGRATAGVLHADVLADFWRARRGGRWLAIGVGGRYDIGLSPGAAGARVVDHRIAPLTALSVVARAERASGLASAALRLEAAHRYSSVRGWEQAFRADAEAELVPIAVNDRPLALFAQLSGASAPELDRAELRLFFGLRFAQPL